MAKTRYLKQIACADCDVVHEVEVTEHSYEDETESEYSGSKVECSVCGGLLDPKEGEVVEVDP